MDSNNDKEFQDYLNNNPNPAVDQLTIIINAINQKANNILKFYSKSLDIYKELEQNDPIKNPLKEFIIDLIKSSIITISQFDYALIDDEEETEETNE